ncbi:MAG: carboxymuconolactone decarboxylase family protein [Bacteroidia bacterium]|jgi:alkylhydroperoxidase family enzyme|nr:carboxymuconolactone decarboxylase family protein [Bacteroidia bacterium]
MDTFLAPLERPSGLFMRIAYAMSRRMLGKVITPLKVVYARLPVGFAMFWSKISKLDGKLSLPAETALLLRECVARQNVCEFCIDIGRAIVIQKNMNAAKFEALNDFENSDLFAVKEKLLLRYVRTLVAEKRGDAELFGKLKAYYSERQLCEAMWVVATESYYNMMNIGLNIHSDMLCDIGKRRKG